MHFVLSTGRADPEACFGGGGPDAGLGAVLRTFVPLCERLAAESGGSVAVAASQAEAEAAARRVGRSEACVHLCFAAPDECVQLAACPTVPVFGWGLEQIPTQMGGMPGPDWREHLTTFGRAICLSHNAAHAVRAAMGAEFAVCTVNPPTVPAASPPPVLAPGTIIGRFALLDTDVWRARRPPVVAFDAQDDLADAVAATPADEVLFRAPAPWRKTLRYRLGTTRLHMRAWYRDALEDLVPQRVTQVGVAATRRLARAARRGLGRPPAGANPLAKQEAGEASVPDEWAVEPLALSGTVFAAVHGMWDRSWSDAISAFVWAFRDTPDVTLLVRSAGIDAGTREALAIYLRRLLPFRCRVLLLDARLTAAQAAALVQASTFYVCASHAEAAPLPLLGFMAQGRPAVAPTHSALADFIDATNAVPVAATPAHDYWPGDGGERLMTRSHRLDWESLCQAFARAHALLAEPGAYANLQQAGLHRLARCDADGERALAAFLGVHAQQDARQTA